MDKSKLPLSLLVALGLAPPGCTTKDPKVHACLKVAPADEGDPPPPDPPAHPCLKVAEPPDEVGPCLEVAEPDPGPCLDVEPDPGPCLNVAEPTKVEPCLGPPVKEPEVGPCLKVAPPKDRGGKKSKKKSDGGMASAGKTRAEVLQRLRGTLPPDVADRLLVDDEES